MVSEKLRSGQEGGFHPPSVSAEEAAPPAFVSEKVLALIPHLALPVSRRSHTGQRAGARLLQVAESSEEVAPLETIKGPRDLVLISMQNGRKPRTLLLTSMLVGPNFEP